MQCDAASKDDATDGGDDGNDHLCMLCSIGLACTLGGGRASADLTNGNQRDYDVHGHN